MWLEYITLILAFVVATGAIAYWGKKQFCTSLSDFLEVNDIGISGFIFIYIVIIAISLGGIILLHGIVFVLGLSSILKVLVVVMLSAIVILTGTLTINWLLKYGNNEED